MNGYASFGLTQFFEEYPGMGLCPIRDSDLRIEGAFWFSAEWKNYGRITDAFHLRITVPAVFPKAVPIVHELGGRIPRTQEYHVNQTDHSLCLGSPLRLLRILAGEPTLNRFSKRCLIPYLYSVSRKLQQGSKFMFGELAHGGVGELADYIDMFRLNDELQAMQAIRCLATKKRLSNKRPCPCDCRKRLGVCAFNRRLRKFRMLASRSWYRTLLSQLLEGVRNKKTGHPNEVYGIVKSVASAS